ncbi:hypothetical protein CTI12_AA202940 [Artemisia annua]|uniref:Ulp1 protease family, C-terminal catalytic domain-containing protein n=1 Tax=Artemisia annua TaxID=35608 RepID=A0A2U1P1L6_ARTAN|nr:hypothetical protein CTI12_AA202940 [Artemisia annua]
MATALRCVGTNACSGIMEEVRVAFKGAALVATEDATLEEDYNKDDDDESIDIEYTDDEEENEPNEYDDTDDIEEEETKDDEDEEEEYNFDDETDNSGIGVERAKFESFYYEQWIFSDIIDVWCILLNHKEFRRSNSGQSKLFCNTQVTPASMTNEDLSKDQRFENFEESVYLVACLVDEYVANFLNVFFNILRDSHYYIICFNLKYQKMIDNRLSDTEADEGSKISEIDLISKLYGKLPFVLINFFCDYLKKKNHPKFHIMRFCKPNILKMAWRTRRNESDCGIFVMRHMETYNGQKVEEWNSGFRNEGEGQQGQLKTLRRKYVAKILLSDENLHRKKIISESIEFLSLPAEDKKHRLKQKTESSSS